MPSLSFYIFIHEKVTKSRSIGLKHNFANFQSRLIRCHGAYDKFMYQYADNPRFESNQLQKAIVLRIIKRFLSI